MNIKMNIQKVTYTKYNNFKYLKTFEDIDEFSLDDEKIASNTSQEEEEKEHTNNVEDSLNNCINDCQQFINMYNSEKYKDLLKVAETAVEFSQVCLNSIKRNYGPIEEIKNVTKNVLNQCASDFKKNENIEMSMQCADKCTTASNAL